MPDRKTNDYTVCILLDSGLEQALLVRKARTDFEGRLNGVGGRVEPEEDPYDGALREIYEETGLSPQDLESLGLVRLAKLGELLVPEDCKTHDGACRLHYYAGAVKDAALGCIRPAEEALEWTPVDRIIGSRPDSTEFAGNGDLAYFTYAAKRAVARYVPAKERKTAAAVCGESWKLFMDGMNAAISTARGRLDADFRRHDLFQASLDAADVSKMAYAAFYLQAAKEHGGTSGKGGAWHAGPEAEKKQERLETDEIV